MAVGTAADQPLSWMITGMVVGETGFMLGSVALTIAATGSLTDDHAGLAAGLLNTATQLGGGIGLGVVTAVVTAAAAGDVTAGALRAGLLACIVFSVLAAALIVGGQDSGVSVRSRGVGPSQRATTNWGGCAMAESHSPADDIVFNLVSIQYHALKAAAAYAKYAADAEGHDDVQEFIERCRQEDARRAERTHELLGKLTAQRGGGIG